MDFPEIAGLRESDFSLSSWSVTEYWEWLMRGYNLHLYWIVRPSRRIELI
jgi:hypothetical protein